MAAQGHSVEVRDGCAGLIFDAEWLLRSSVPRGRRGVLVLAAAGGREAGGESGHFLVCGSGEEIRRVERSGRGQSLLGSVKSSIIIYYQNFVDFVHFWSFFSQVSSFCNACVFVFEVHGVNVRFKREDTLVGRVSWTSFWNFVSTSRGSGVVQKGKERRGPECHACRTALYCTQFWR